VYIDITGPDDGSVICTESNLNYWRFKTIRAPWSGTHPVSGTREFGIKQNNDGSYDLNTRGVDRFKSNFIENISTAMFFGNAFDGADSLWELMQQNMAQYINENGGSADKRVPIKERPDWNLVEKVLKGNEPISSLGCN